VYSHEDVAFRSALERCRYYW